MPSFRFCKAPFSGPTLSPANANALGEEADVMFMKIGDIAETIPTVSPETCGQFSEYGPNRRRSDTHEKTVQITPGQHHDR